MTDPLTWSPINLGRWSGTTVRIHITLILFVVFKLLNAAMETGHPVSRTAAWLLLLLVALAIHEMGHAAMASWLGTDRDEVRLWPLGNMVGPSGMPQSPDHMLVALAGPATNLAVVVVTAVALNLAGARFVWNPFGHVLDSGAPLLANGDFARSLTAAWWIGWFGYLNWVLVLANLIPALPFDGGRFLRAALSGTSAVSTRDSMVGPWFARSCAAVLGLAGLVRLLVPPGNSDGLTLIGLALLIELMVRSEARMLEDGGFFDDGVFGYDFSEGYTSLEGGAAKVRPYRESAIKRWRRRRSEFRRQRRQAREDAEERRLDEILEKVHREGRSALTDDEHRFLVRVSARLRKGPKTRG